jgi:hypothetical protein
MAKITGFQNLLQLTDIRGVESEGVQMIHIFMYFIHIVHIYTYVVFVFEIGSHHIAQASLELCKYPTLASNS